MLHPRTRSVLLRLALGWLVVAQSIIAGAHWHHPSAVSLSAPSSASVAGDAGCPCPHDRLESAQGEWPWATERTLPKGSQVPDEGDGRQCPDGDDCALCRAALQSSEIAPRVIAPLAWILTGYISSTPVAGPASAAPPSYQGRAPPMG
ncbi:MAG: hypothetical protein U0795_08360 [Pirellulales bacterium]